MVNHTHCIFQEEIPSSEIISIPIYNVHSYNEIFVVAKYLTGLLNNLIMLYRTFLNIISALLIVVRINIANDGCTVWGAKRAKTHINATFVCPPDI